MQKEGSYLQQCVDRQLRALRQRQPLREAAHHGAHDHVDHQLQLGALYDAVEGHADKGHGCNRV